MSLPNFIFPPSLRRAPFYPVLSNAPRQEVVYELTGERGRSLGPAMTISYFGQGRVLVIDHLLWKSRVEGRPFARATLPTIIAWAALGPEEQ